MQGSLLNKNALEITDESFEVATNSLKQIGQYVHQANVVKNITINSCGSDLVFDNILQDGFLSKTINNRYYNLIILDRYGVLGDSKFSIRSNLVLLETDDSIRKSLLSFDKRVQNEIKGYPTVICKLKDPEVEYGFLSNLILNNGALDFTFVKLPVFSLTKTSLLNIHQELGIGYATDCNELEEPHWAVKKANLVQVLKCYGYEIPTVSF